MSTFVWLIPLFPLLGTLVNALAWRRIGHRAHVVAVGAVALSFLFSCAVFARVWAGETYVGELTSWITAGDFKVPLSFQVDHLTGIMLLGVTGVSLLIHVYSIGYMHEDRDYARFFTYLNLFVFSMLILVLAGNFLLLFVGWEAVGLCSYLLIGFWYEKKSASDAAVKAFVVNRVGDVGFTLGVMLIFVTFGTLEYREVFARADASVGAGTYLAIALLLFMGACGKSAQLPLYTWLPDAMEGPTPVSALIHAATMVTAGVYMVARCHVLFERAPLALETVAWVGGLTALFAATIGMAQTDIKKVLAYSTISQLGYMFAGVGIGAYAAGIFHLFTHAFFKALLFLGAGSVIHGMSGEQDMRKMGGLASRMRTTAITFVIAGASLAGLPPFAGFFSKDEIISATFLEGQRLLWLVLVVAAGLTAFYTFRVIFLTFCGEPRLDRQVAHHVHESPAVMTIPLVVLAVLTVGAGVIGIPTAHGSAFARFLSPTLPMPGGEPHRTALIIELAALSVAVGLVGVGVAWAMYMRRPVRAEEIGVARSALHRLVLNKYYVDEIYDGLFVQPLLGLCRWCARVFDGRVIDGLVNGVGEAVVTWARGLRRLQTGFVMNYALTMLLGAVAVLAFLLSR